MANEKKLKVEEKNLNKEEKMLTKANELKGASAYIPEDRFHGKPTPFKHYLREFEEKFSKCFCFVEELGPMMENIVNWCNENRIDWDSLVQETGLCEEVLNDCHSLEAEHLLKFCDGVSDFIFIFDEKNYE